MSRKRIPKNKQTDAITAIVEDADKYQSLKAIFDQDGGKLLVDALIQDVVGSIGKLENYPSMTRDELVAVIARLSTSLNMARTLTRAEKNSSLADEALEDALRE